MQIYIGVENKVAQLVDLKQYIVCGNSDYTINFLFDDEWNDHVAKTARFEWGSNSVEVPFTGTQCPCPVITDTIVVKIGVFAGDLDATTPAYVMCRKSILCGSGGHDDPSLDVYNQLMGLLDEMQTGGASPENNLYFVEYEKTTHKEVENAVIAGKFCVMFISGYTYVLADSGNTGVAYDFYAINRPRYLRWLRLETDNTWTPQQFTLVSEQMMTKYLTQYSGDNQIPTAKAVYDAIEDLKQNGTGGSGITSDVKTALLNAFAHVAWTDENGQSYYDALATALNASGGDSGGGDEGGEGETPVVTLTSISAVYGGGEVASGTALTDLTDIVVTAHYSDGTTKTITNYTLSGEIVAGTNTITVSYGGMTTTFEVIGTASARTYLELDAYMQKNSTSGITAYSDDGETTATISTAKGYVADRTFETDVDVHFKFAWSAETVYRNLYIASAVPTTPNANNTYEDISTMYRVKTMKDYYVEGQGDAYTYEGNVYEGIYTLKAGCVLTIGNMNNINAGQIDTENAYFYVEG